MFTPEMIRITVVVAICLFGIFAPMCLAETVFKRPGREVASAVCYITTGVLWSSIWVFGLITSIIRGSASDIVGFSLFSAIGFAVIGASIWALVSEVKKRRKIIAETLF